MAENNYKSDSDGIVSQEFTPKNQNVKGLEQLSRDKAWVKKKAASLVHGLFNRATKNKDVGTLGRDDSRKEGDQVYTADMGIIETGVPKPSLPEKPPVEPATADHVKYEEMAEAIKNGPTSPNEDKERQIVVDQEAKAKADQEARAARQRVAGDSSAYDAYQQDRERLQQNAAEPNSWIANESRNTDNIAHGMAEKTLTDRAASGELNSDKLRMELFKTGQYDGFEETELAAKKIEEQIARDKAAKDPVFTDEQVSEAPEVKGFDRHYTVINEEMKADEAAARRDNNAQREQAERERSGSGWAAMDKPEERPSEEVKGFDRHYTVIDQEMKADQESARRVNEAAREERQKQLDQADSEASGRRWNNLGTETPYPMDTGGNPIRPPVPGIADVEPTIPPTERATDGSESIAGEVLPGADRYQRIREGVERGVDEEVDRWERLFQEKDNIVVIRKREKVREKTQLLPKRWRRAIAIAGLVGLGLIGVNLPGASLPIETPFVPMPEIGKAEARSPLDNLPKVRAQFKTEGPAGEAISPAQADLGGWFDGEWADNYLKQHPEYISQHPDQFPDGPQFDMRHPEVMEIVRQSPDFQEAKQMFTDYVATHEIRGGNMSQRVQAEKNPDGSYKSVVISVPSQDGVDLPDVSALANYLANQKGT